MRAGLVASQLLGLALTRYVLMVPPVVMMPPDFIIRMIGATVQRYAAGEDLDVDPTKPVKSGMRAPAA